MSEERRVRRSDDTLVAEALIHLQYLRRGLDDLNVKVGTQNGRIGVSEGHIAHLMEQTEATNKEVAARLEKRSRDVDRNMKLLALLMTLIGAAVTLVVKFL